MCVCVCNILTHALFTCAAMYSNVTQNYTINIIIASIQVYQSKRHCVLMEPPPPPFVTLILNEDTVLSMSHNVKKNGINGSLFIKL